MRFQRYKPQHMAPVYSGPKHLAKLQEQRPQVAPDRRETFNFRWPKLEPTQKVPTIEFEPLSPLIYEPMGFIDKFKGVFARKRRVSTALGAVSATALISVIPGFTLFTGSEAKAESRQEPVGLDECIDRPDESFGHATYFDVDPKSQQSHDGFTDALQNARIFVEQDHDVDAVTAGTVAGDVLCVDDLGVTWKPQIEIQVGEDFMQPGAEHRVFPSGDPAHFTLEAQ